MLNQKNNLVFSLLLISLLALSSGGVAYAVGYNASSIVGQHNFFLSKLNFSPNSEGFNLPTDVVVDDVHHRAFVADYSNNRVLVFNLDSNNNPLDMTADYVLGQSDFYSNGSGLSASQFYGPYGLAYDSSRDYLFVSDKLNNRVLVFDASTITNGEDAIYVLGQPDFVSNTANQTGDSGMFSPTGIDYDNVNKRLFVSMNNRVLVYDLTSISNGESAVYVLGQPDFNSSVATTTRSGVNIPVDVAYDPTNSRLFVVDQFNNRVLVFDASSKISNGEDADNVLGQSDFVSGSASVSQSGLDDPTGVAFDVSRNHLFVSDSLANRIMVFDVLTITNGENAIGVLGQNNFTDWTLNTTRNGLKGPYSGSVVGDKFFVADHGNNRIMIFTVSLISNGANASNLLGQTDDNGNPMYTIGNNDNTPNNLGLYNPEYSTIDTIHHRLFVSDTKNNRILVFNLSSNNKLEDTYADYVIGQTSFKFNGSGTSSSSLSSPEGLDYDSVNNRLFVTDKLNNRVLVFDVSNLHNGISASYVIGQPDFSSNGSGTTQSSMNNPTDLSYDEINSRLFVGEYGNDRVLVFDLSSGITNGMNASYLLGQADFSASTNPLVLGPDNYYYTSRNALAEVTGVEFDSSSNYLFVSDYSSNRVLVYDVSSITNNEDPIYVLGRPDFTSTGIYYSGHPPATLPSPSSNTLALPTGINLAKLANGNLKLLFVADSSNNRIMIFDVTSITNGEDAIGVLGQTDFTSNSCLTTQYGLCNPNDSSWSDGAHSLYVVDTNNNRILGYDLIKIITDSLPKAVADQNYYQSISVQNNQGTVEYALLDGSLPPGMQLGSLEGTPTKPGTYTFTVEAKDNLGGIGYFADAKTYTLVIDPPPGPSLPPIAFAPPTPPSSGGTGTATQGFTVKINNDEETTTSRNVILTLNGGPDAVTMAISNNPDFKGAVQEPYKATKEWTLEPGNGVKNVYVKFYTKWGQSSEPASDSIILTGQPENLGQQVSSQAKQISQEVLDSIQQQIQIIMQKILELQKEILKLLGR